MVKLDVNSGDIELLFTGDLKEDKVVFEIFEDKE